MAIVREIEDSGYVEAPDLYEKWRTDMRALLQCADLRPFYGRAGRWGVGTREWFAANMLQVGSALAPYSQRALNASSEAAIVALELLTRWEASDGPAWVIQQREAAKKEKALAEAAE